jgi:outer membrane protein assembly factor BamB
MKRKKLKRHHSGHFNFVGMIIILLISAVIVYLFYIFKPPPESKNNVNAAGPVVWQQFDGNEGKTGTSSDPYITTSTVTTLQKIWQVPVSSDGSPVYLSNVTTAQGVKNLVFVTTTSGGLTAFDEATGNKIWSVATSGSAGTTTSSPAIDPNNLFVYSYGKDGKVHKYDVGTGTEETSGGWPLTATLIPNVEKGSSALSIGNGYLYVSTSAYPEPLSLN